MKLKNTVINIFILVILWASPEKFSLVYIPEINSEKVSILTSAGFNLDHSFNFTDNRFEIAILTEEIELLNNTGLSYSIEHYDLEAFYRSRLFTDPSRDFETGSMGGYYTFEEMVEQLDALRQEYPHIVSPKFSIGTTLEGRNIWGIKLSDNPSSNEAEPDVLYTGMHHSREPMSYMNLFYFMYWLCENYEIEELATNILNNRELFFIPMVNPDGLMYNYDIAPNGGGMQRKNRRETCGSDNNYDQWDGIDLNRNYSFYWGYDDYGSSPSGCSQTYRGFSPFSEPETQYIRNFVQSRDFKIALNYHSYSNLLIYPFGWEPETYPPEDDHQIFIEFGTDMTQYNGYLLGTGIETVGYTVNGEANDWMYGEEGIIAFTPEIGGFSDGFWPATNRIVPLAEENLYPNQFVALASGPMYELDLSTEDDYYEPGMTYALNLYIRNKGLTSSSGEIQINLSADPIFELAETEFILGSLDRRTDAELFPIVQFTIASNVQPGTFGSFSVIIHDDENIFYSDTHQIVVGVPQVLINENFENFNNEWIVGSNFDDATSGIWEWGEPNQTSQSGNIVQTGEDHTINGINCFVTGNSVSANSVGYDDVDGGTTTLYSPIFNLESELGVLVSYWVWFSNELGDNPGTDRWIVEYTNNGGTTWSLLESTTVAERNWVKRQIFLNEPEIQLTSLMGFRFKAEDIYHDGDNGSGGSLVEAALDDFSLSVFQSNPLLLGDINGDLLINVIDILLVVNHIIDEQILSGIEYQAADLDQNNEINVLDVVQIVSLILGEF